MLYVSTRDKQHLNPVNLATAVIKGLADDGGLYMPIHINTLGNDVLQKLPFLELPEIAGVLLNHLLAGAVSASTLQAISSEVFDFPIPLEAIGENIYSLELFHGPTLAFKDVGARFMSRLMKSFEYDDAAELKVAVATSGDTGSAVAAGFHAVKGVKVYVLFPKGKVSKMQQKQLTTWGDNIIAVEVDGTFDDCQRHVKMLLSDPDLKTQALLTSANSINIARLLPQAVYYAYAWSRLTNKNNPLVISVPSGNFGNLTAGLIAHKAGIPIHHFIASTNVNDSVPNYLDTGVFKSKPSLPTISNAMDVGNPSNFERMLHLFDDKQEQMRELITGYSFTDAETMAAISNLYETTGYIADPHGAVGYLGLKKFIQEKSFTGNGLFLETAHPAKFGETVEKCILNAIPYPERLAAFDVKDEKFIACPNAYDVIKMIVLER